MTTDYQLAILSYLVQSKDGKTYIQSIEDAVFDLLEFKIILQILKKYHKLYNVLPTKVTLDQFLLTQIAETKDLSPQITKDLNEVAEDIFIPLPEQDMVSLRDSIILEIQQKSIDDTFLDFAQSKLSVTQVFTKMHKLASLVKTDFGYDAFTKGGFLVRDKDKFKDERIYGAPTFLHDLNNMTAAGGFYSPQLIVFLSGPKMFKTGTILRTAIEYVRGGMKVYYADNENGATQVRNRAKMGIMECELSELFDGGIEEELNETLDRFHRYMGGDLFIDEYPAYIKSMNDLKARLTQLKEEFNWEPDIIVLDTIDKFIPNSIPDRNRDPRIRIQLVYDDVINLNKELGTFAIVPSQVNRKAVGKKVFDIQDLAEDFAKSMNAHAIFAICMTPEEEELGIRRIIPVIQREGVSYKGGKHICVVKVDEKRMMVEEVDSEEYMKNIKDE